MDDMELGAFELGAFELDSQLANDCFVLGELDLSLLLLRNNALIPWFILVPKVNVVELYELEEQMQASLFKEINEVSIFLKDKLNVHKINIASIGNKVKQLHIHVIGRNEDDFCWPEVVWSQKQNTPYTNDQVKAITQDLEVILGDNFHAL